MNSLRELQALVARHAPAPDGVWQSEDLGLRVRSVGTAGTPRHDVYEPVFALVVQGEKQLILGDKVFSCMKGSFIVVSVDLPLAFQITRATRQEPYMALTMSLKPAAVAALLLEAGATAPDPASLTTSALGVSDASTELLDAVVRLLRLLDHPRDLAVLAPLAEKEILWRLLCSEQGPRLRQIGLADSRLAQIGRTIRFLRENFHETVPVAELARLAGMSVTSFHRHFRAVTLLSPLQYVKHIRLQAARARLLSDAEDIAAVGYAVGYDSPSQFSREYKRAYGCPPGEDARALRASHTTR